VSATDLLIWGTVIHLVIDWLAQNEWMAVNKAKRRKRFEWRADGTWITRWWDRHPAAYVHAGLHGGAQLLIFPWPAALAIAVTHLLIDTRVPVIWWSKLIRQTQPAEVPHALVYMAKTEEHEIRHVADAPPGAPILMDLGAEVRIWVDQVWHVAVIALTALAVSL